MTFSHSGGRPILSPALPLRKCQGALRTAALSIAAYCSMNSVWLVTL
jgi:hypothetical protein